LLQESGRKEESKAEGRKKKREKLINKNQTTEVRLNIEVYLADQL